MGRTGQPPSLSIPAFPGSGARIRPCTPKLCRQSRRTPAQRGTHAPLHNLGQQLLLFLGSCDTASLQPARNAAEAPDGPRDLKRPALLPQLSEQPHAPPVPQFPH